MRLKTKDPGKQRKMLYEMPYHSRGNILSAHLSTDLRNMYGARALPVRKGDTVRVLRGDYEGYEGKILRVNRQKYKIYVDGITREKADGTSIQVPIHPSKVEIIKLNLDDKWRNKIIERKRQKEEEKPEEKELGERKNRKKGKKVNKPVEEKVEEEK
ncbi:50S ribosomal protein L24 [Candidatus Bathyarchaeota archaeon]|nr:50S ribosomal protein L24 [Candidatus Bathyarchaeota archaeon]